MEQLLNLKSNKTGENILAIQFEDAPGKMLSFDLIMRMDRNKLEGELRHEKFMMLAVLHDHLSIILRSYSRSQSNKSDS